MRDFTGEQIAQVDNADPFAAPVWRSPVHRTPEWVIWLVQLVRLLVRVIWFLIRHPLLDVAAGLVILTWAKAGWPGVAILANVTIGVPGDAAAVAAGLVRPARHRAGPVPVAVAGLPAPLAGRHDHRRAGTDLPGPGHPAGARQGPGRDVRGPGDASGWSPGSRRKAFADRADELAHGFRVCSCRIRTARPGLVVLELVRRDALAAVIPALPIPAVTDLRALPVGRREDGEPFTIRLHGTHLLIAGATGAGKGSYLWGLVRAMLPAMAAGLVQVHACDPKLMELAFGRAMFERFGKYAADPADIADLLEADVRDMQARAARFAGRQRDHTPTTADPFVVVLVDEVAFLTAYQADRKLKERILAALATLTTQGRAVGYCVVAALQDPRKEVLNIRNLFPDKIALRLDEPTQVDLVLGDGAHDRGALCEDISADPATGAGVGYVRLEADPDPVRVRAAFVTDDDIHAMTATVTSEALMTTGWLSPEDCPDCGGPLLDTSTDERVPAPGVPRLRLPHPLAHHRPRRRRRRRRERG